MAARLHSGERGLEQQQDDLYCVIGSLHFQLASSINVDSYVPSLASQHLHPTTSSRIYHLLSTRTSHWPVTMSSDPTFTTLKSPYFNIKAETARSGRVLAINSIPLKYCILRW
jgi:hypothetical protein